MPGFPGFTVKGAGFGDKSGYLPRKFQKSHLPLKSVRRRIGYTILFNREEQDAI
jgi:hypothetical protein